ncbi:EthD domain-containing protein [Glaciibacter sp. 2TAF33]|uniref:EthD domain-containing protein n=1 Tax=Glaciibacter sp. 2TAF33 TaxID=3233015 RepID=UPI003F91FD52
MIKAVSLHSRNPNLSVEEFVEYWHTVHAPLCARLMQGLGLRRYVASFPIINSPNFGGVGPDFDIVAEIYFDDRESLEAALSSPQFNTPERMASSAHLFDLENSRNAICEETSFPV